MTVQGESGYRQATTRRTSADRLSDSTGGRSSTRARSQTNVSGGTIVIAGAFIGQGGTVDVQTGAIELDGGSLSGSFAITQGTFSLNGTVALEDGLNVSGAGTLDLVGGTTTLSDTASLSNFAMNGGTLIVDGTATLPTFAQSGGTLTGAGTLTVTGLTTWTGGSMTGTGTTDAAGGLAVGDAGINAQVSLDQRTLDNGGAGSIISGYAYGQLLLSSGATLDNEPGASFTFLSD